MGATYSPAAGGLEGSPWVARFTSSLPKIRLTRRLNLLKVLGLPSGVVGVASRSDIVPRVEWHEIG